MPRKPLYGREAIAQRKRDRERRLLHYLSHGMTIDEIAHEMSYSPHTVRWWIRHMFLETGARNRAHLVGMAYREGMLEVEDDA